jgi:hypothetical protein
MTPPATRNYLRLRLTLLALALQEHERRNTNASRHAAEAARREVDEILPQCDFLLPMERLCNNMSSYQVLQHFDRILTL